VEADGALTVTSYTGLPTSTTYASLTVFYPTNGTGPYVVVMLSPGTAEVLSLLTPWAKRLASHGYVAVFVEPNNTSSDTAQMRADGQWDAVATMKAENTRAGSPLVGKLSDCYVVAGHSFGGGAALLNANAHPTEVKAALGFNPYETTTFSAIVAPTLILTGQNDTTAPPASHGLKHYNDIPATTVKEYVEIAGGNHQSALNPGTVPSHYTISWIKYNVDGDTRYRPLLDMVSTGLSGFQTTLP
jgi:predicted dienelactone hydrolase